MSINPGLSRRPALVALPPKILACHLLPSISMTLAQQFGVVPGKHVSAGFITCDQDDSLYAALDEATKSAQVDIVFARSLYAGAAHASGPYSGEVMGVLAGPTPDDVAEGLWAVKRALSQSIHFTTFEGTQGPAFFSHVISRTGRYLSASAQIQPGEPMGYFIAPPLEAAIGLDFALKNARVTLAKFFPPPTETNFSGGYLTGPLNAIEAAAEAFVEGIWSVVQSPNRGLVRPTHERH